MPKTIHQNVTFRASPDALFDTYLSSRKHSAATDAKAVMSRRVGGTFSAHAGHVRGRNLAIVPKRLIVQSWRGSNWKKQDLDSTLVLVFSRVPSGGRISMTHVNVPDANAASIKRGWGDYYWKPWKKYLRQKGPLLKEGRRCRRSSLAHVVYQTNRMKDAVKRYDGLTPRRDQR